MKSSQADKLQATFLSSDSFDRVIDFDCDAYDTAGSLLFRFRKGALDLDLVRSGYLAFKGAIAPTQMRGVASGGSFKKVRLDGTLSKTSVGNPVFSSVVGYMDESAKIPYCRKTAFTQKYFEKFSGGVPFVKRVDELYKELCPLHYSRQAKIAAGTNKNYVIADTTFTTVTVNKNFQTAVHKDAGDYVHGFGNLCVYREGHYDGCFFCLPEYRVAIDMQNTDMLFVDVHRWHGNTPFLNMSPDYLRIAFVMYYREYMINCKQPSQNLKDVKMAKGGLMKL